MSSLSRGKGMFFCKICGEYFLLEEMAFEDICVYCNKTIIHTVNKVDNDGEIEEDDLNN
jgi:hypothetical protein